MPKATANQLQREIASGSEGIDRVIDALRQVDSARAEAWKWEDEQRCPFPIGWLINRGVCLPL